MTLHAFTVVDNSIAFKSFVGDENMVQKFEGEFFQLVISSCFAIIELYKIILLIKINTYVPIVCNHLIFF